MKKSNNTKQSKSNARSQKMSGASKSNASCK